MYAQGSLDQWNLKKKKKIIIIIIISKICALFLFIEKLKNSLCQSVEEKYGGQNQGQTQARGHRQTTQKVWQDVEKRYI